MFDESGRDEREEEEEERERGVVSRDRGSYIGCKVESREKEEERMRGEDIYIYKTDRSLLGSRHAEVHAEIERERESRTKRNRDRSRYDTSVSDSAFFGERKARKFRFLLLLLLHHAR